MLIVIQYIKWAKSNKKKEHETENKTEKDKEKEQETEQENETKMKNERPGNVTFYFQQQKMCHQIK